MSWTTLEFETTGPVGRLWLNRPDVHNAFDTTLIEELTGCLREIGARSDLRVIVLGGRGKSFCAGADIAMMRKAAAMTDEENRQDARRLAGLFETLNDCPLAVVGRAQGAALGGGMGLLSCCDIVVAEAGCRFGFTEVKLGILPAVISPFVTAKIGLSAARAHFGTGARFDAAEALRIGLVHRVAAGEAGLDRLVDEIVGEYLTAAPGAVALAKQLVRELDVPDRTGSPAVRERTAQLIAGRRASDEGREGLAAYLERRRPAWWAELPGDEPTGSSGPRESK